jgi:tight adherence protein C
VSLVLFGLLFITIAASFFALGAALTVPSSAIGVRLRALMPQRDEGVTQKRPLKERLKDDFVEPLAAFIPTSAKSMTYSRELLVMAGYREQRHIRLYQGSRALLAIIILIVFLATGIAEHRLMLVLAGVALAYVTPRFVLKRMIAKRQLRIRRGLPDALDLSVICVEAGLGLDQALQRVGNDIRHAHMDLSSELNLVGLEMRAGKARAEALRNLALRTGVNDVRALVAVLIQTDRFGTSVAQALRVHSDCMRTERRQRAEEQAAKTTIKMVLPLVLCVFPSMFVVSIGPALIQLVRHLLPELG